MGKLLEALSIKALAHPSRSHPQSYPQFVWAAATPPESLVSCGFRHPLPGMPHGLWPAAETPL